MTSDRNATDAIAEEQLPPRSEMPRRTRRPIRVAAAPTIAYLRWRSSVKAS
jgi:hypothetical protein